jgi:PAS domain S-box-containing protein
MLSQPVDRLNSLSLHEIIESIPEAFVIYDAEDRFVACNEAHRRLYQDSAEVFVPGVRYEDIMRTALEFGRFPEAIGREEEWLAEWMRKHHEPDAPVELHLSDGRWVLVSERRMPNGGIAGLRTDITALKAVETALTENRMQLAKMAEELRRGHENLLRAQRITHTGSIVRDLTAPDKVEFSQEMYRLLGWDPSKPPPGKESFIRALHPEDRQKFLRMTQQAEQGLPTEPIDVRIIRPDGSIRWLHNIAETTFDADGRPIGRIATFTDVTDMREAERIQKELESSLRLAKDAAEAANRAVKAANEALEIRVEERTRELREAQEELIKKERLSALGQLTATVAHELRNPMSAIRNSAYTIRETIGEELPRLERPLGRLDRSILRCETLISDLLHFTRPKEPRRVPLHLDEWLGGVLDEHKLPEPITLERRFRASGVLAAVDAEQFERVIINLTSNAVQAMIGDAPTTKAGRILVATEFLADQVQISIQDAGPGIAAEVLPHVFEPLFTTKSFGTGLGLPTVKQIVEGHGGTISIDSVLGRGTTVRICLSASQVKSAVA